MTTLPLSKTIMQGHGYNFPWALGVKKIPGYVR